jgi:hypothetical protein
VFSWQTEKRFLKIIVCLVHGFWSVCEMIGEANCSRFDSVISKYEGSLCCKWWLYRSSV